MGENRSPHTKTRDVYTEIETPGIEKKNITEMKKRNKY